MKTEELLRHVTTLEERITTVKKYLANMDNINDSDGNAIGKYMKDSIINYEIAILRLFENTVINQEVSKMEEILGGTALQENEGAE